MQSTAWQPDVNLTMLQLRAEMLARIRDFFSARGVLEVDTPAMSTAAVTDPHLASFSTCFNGPGPRYQQTLYLHTSPEFGMKRLLAAGSGDIYQIAKVFRDGELGDHHNPEFTLLEWYRLGFDHHCLMDEVAALIMHLRYTFSDTPVTVRRYAYRELFQMHLALDPLQSTVAELSRCACDNNISFTNGMSLDNKDAWLDLLLSHCIEPRLDPNELTFVYDYPATQAALARIHANDPTLAERFELYWGGLELANGFHELKDANEQRRRFQADNRSRAKLGVPLLPLDEQFLAALPQLPDCSGVALGIDRLLMLQTGKTRLGEVLVFPFPQEDEQP